ncbi:MAG TPA: SMP-30/gluconolactonase/LRE family protein [Pyrinomonadaceae bacterium]|nr:SMP-30/gluconolactonase/LRE family protein [Pyrinomonadaceae bacterium]
MKILSAILLTILFSLAVFAGEVPSGKAEASVDLTTADGAKTVKGIWKYSDTRIIETDFKSAGADNQPTGAAVKTYDYTPKAGVADFDDSNWEAIAPTDLNKRRGNGRISFNWYRINITIPESVNGFDTGGATVVFQTALDDYAEIWVNGEISRYLGQQGGSVVSGWNAPNRLIIGRNVRAGQKIQLAVFGINGPISNPPTNYIWVREAKLEFYKGSAEPLAITPSEVNVEIVKKDDALEKIVGANPKLWKLAEGFKFTEGPVWTNDGLLFSDPNSNTIYKYSKDAKLSVFRSPSGYSGADIAEYVQPGSNGLTLDEDANLVINQHGNRRVIRLEKTGGETVLADKFEGKRLNSPNDLVYRSDGTLFFTDPPFGLPKVFDDTRKELNFSGVYSIYKGKLQLLTKEFTGPNGIAFSPDEKYLYVGNWDAQKKTVYRYEVNTDGTIKNGKLFFDFTGFKGEDAIDGIKVDTQGNLYVSAPGGLQVLSKDGKFLGTIVTPQHVHNMAWGDADGKTLYLCARNGLYKMRLNVAGVRPKIDQAK